MVAPSAEVAMSLGSLWLGVGLLSCLACAAGSGQTRGSITAAELAEGGHSRERVTLVGYVVPGLLGCLDMECPGPTGCCGVCTATPVLVDSAESAVGIEITPQGTKESFICRDSDKCELVCTPPSGRRLEVVGVSTGGRIPALLVERWRVIP
jgi:hypothetical protein